MAKRRRAMKPFPFLRLPPEIRNRIYSYLYWWQPLCDGTIPPINIEDHIIRPKHNFTDLVSLMRASRQLHAEASTLLYTIPFSFPESISTSIYPGNSRAFNLNYLSSDGFARHLRHVHVEIPRLKYGWGIRHSYSKHDNTKRARRDRKPYDETILWSLAQNAKKLETLTITHPRHQPFSPSDRRLASLVSDGPVRTEWSWMDPLPLVSLLPLKFRTGAKLRYPPSMPDKKELAAISECLAQEGDTLGQQRIEEKILERFGSRNRRRTRGNTGEHWIKCWEYVWRRLWHWEMEKKFWAGDVMELFKEVTPTLKILGFNGVVDRKWMQVVAELMNVEVRGAELGGGMEGDEWVVVRPAGFGNEDGMGVEHG